MTTVTLPAHLVALAIKARIDSEDAKWPERNRMIALWTMATAATNSDAKTVTITIEDFEKLHRFYKDKDGVQLFSTFIGNG